MGRTSNTWLPCPWTTTCTRYRQIGKNIVMGHAVKKEMFNFQFCVFKQKSVEIGHDLPGLKLQTLHVGGLPGADNHVSKGFVGCIQVSACVSKFSLFFQSLKRNLTAISLSFFFFFFFFFSIRVCVWVRRPPTWPMWTWLRVWRSAWKTAATWLTPATPTSARRTATAVTTGARTPVSVTQVRRTYTNSHTQTTLRNSYTSLSRVWESLVTLCSVSCRLFWDRVCGCLPAQPLWACLHLRSQTKFFPRLHLWMRTELLRPVLWKQVRPLPLWICVCVIECLDRDHGEIFSNTQYLY